MLRHVMTGAAAVLTVGMLAVGCSDDGDTIIQMGQGTVNNQDQFPATSIFANQVSHDGGGVSPNDTDVTASRVIWSCDICWSDGTFQGDGSALILFTTAGGSGPTPNTPQKLWVSHYNGQTLTQPVTLLGVDQDETLGAPNLASAVALQLNTSGYTAAQQADTQRIQQNDKVWVLLYSATTFSNSPSNANTQAVPLGSTVGPHRTIYYTAFDPSNRNNNLATRSDFIGTNNPVNLQFGWVLPAIEVVPANARTGMATDLTSNIGQQAPQTLASDVQSFGLVSDGFAGQTMFGGTGLPLTNTNGVLGQPSQTAYNRAAPTSGMLRAATFNGGERTTLVQVFYTQILNSLAAGGGSVTLDTTNNILAGGARLAAFSGSLNLSTLQWETPTEFRPAAARNAATSLTTSPGTGFYPTFTGYNQSLFYKYADASLQAGVTNNDPLVLTGVSSQGPYDNTGADEGGILNANTFHEDIIGVVTFQDDGDGTSSIAPGSVQDLSTFNSAPGVHDTVNPPATGPLAIVNREIMNFNIGGGFPFIFGADEGLGDTTILYSSADNITSGAGTDLTPNTFVRAGMAAAINNGAVGTLGSLVAGSPFVWSTHAGAEQDFTLLINGGTLSGVTDVKKDPLVAPGQPNGGDGNHDVVANAFNDEDVNGGLNNFGLGNAFYFVPVMNRSGEYISIGYMQDTGTSSSATSASFHRGLKVVTYQTFQTFQSVGSNSVGGLTQVNLNLRFSAPQEISQTGATVSLVQDQNTLTGINTSAETQTRWDALPVSNFSAQSLVNYRCAFQSNNRIIHYVWEQSDATEDRLFSRQVTYVTNASGTPSPAVLAAPIEYETGNLVSAHLNTSDNNASSGERSTFTFLDGNVMLGTTVYATDMGGTDQGQGVVGGLPTNAGSLIVFFSKITDATTTDGDFGNTELIMNTVIGNTLGNRISLGRPIDENLTLANAPLQVVGVNSSAAGVLNFNISANSFAGYQTTASVQNTTGNAGQGGLAGYLSNASWAFLSVPNNADIGNNPNYQPDAIYVYTTAPSGNNGSSYRALVTRKIDLVAFRTQQGATIPSSIVPSAGTTGPGSVGYLEPTRLDHSQSANVFALSTGQRGTAAGVLWRQGNHVWGQVTNDGVNYLTQNGGPNPALVDQDSRTNVSAYALSLCTDQNGDAQDGIVTLNKADEDGDIRLQVRTALRVGQ